MRRILQTVSWISLALSILPSLGFYFGWMDLDRQKQVLLVAMIVWFLVTPMWMGRREAAPDADAQAA